MTKKKLVEQAPEVMHPCPVDVGLAVAEENVKKRQEATRLALEGVGKAVVELLRAGEAESYSVGWRDGIAAVKDCRDKE
jgi:hypothetical protein